MKEWKYGDILRAKGLLGEDLGKARRELAISKLPRLVIERTGSPEPALPFAPWLFDNNDRSSIEVGYKTGSGNVMSLLVRIFPMSREDVPLLTEYEQVKLCGNCKGSSGGCPGFAPRFDSVKMDCRNLMIVTISIDMIWAIMYATPKDGWLGRRVLKQLVYADRLTENYCRRLVRYLVLQDHYTLGAGNCLGCNPKFCSVIRGNNCTKPDSRTFSVEAVGVDCDYLHEFLFGSCLPWYYRGTNKIPTYMTRYLGLFYDDDPDIIIEEIVTFVGSDKSFVELTDVPPLREATVSLQEIPNGVHRGDFQYVYNDPGLVQV